ncbi:hypothetical protein QT236_17540 [Geobacillus stearothermophilus]|nr:hypothetical protein QT236_17540 [Geobacillus stearothermophilus]
MHDICFFYRASLGGPDERREQKFATLVGDHFGMSPTNILLTRYSIHWNKQIDKRTVLMNEERIKDLEAKLSLVTDAITLLLDMVNKEHKSFAILALLPTSWNAWKSCFITLANHSGTRTHLWQSSRNSFPKEVQC